MNPPEPFVWDGPAGRERSEVKCLDCGGKEIPAGCIDLHHCD